MSGGLGNDTYAVDDANDMVFEAVGEGADRVLVYTSFVLTSGAEVELLSAANQASVAALDLTGNGFANNIQGNNGVNVLNGGGNNDALFGLDGADTLHGGMGADTFGYRLDTEGGLAAGMDFAAGTVDTISNLETSTDDDVLSFDANGLANAGFDGAVNIGDGDTTIETNEVVIITTALTNGNAATLDANTTGFNGGTIKVGYDTNLNAVLVWFDADGDTDNAGADVTILAQISQINGTTPTDANFAMLLGTLTTSANFAFTN